MYLHRNGKKRGMWYINKYKDYRRDIPPLKWERREGRTGWNIKGDIFATDFSDSGVM